MKIAVITGASSGLGVEFTKTIIKQYPKLDEIWIIARRKDRLKNLARHNPDKKIRAITLDLGADEEYSKLETLLSDEKPQISILVNNAGYECSGNFRDMSASDIQNMISVNVKGLTMVQRICSPYFAKDSFAIMTCSVSSFTPIPHQAVYSASKRYIYALGKALREEEKRNNVNILLLCPGNMDTEMNPKGQARQSKQINTLPFLDMEKVTKNALARAEHKKAVYTPGRFYIFYRVVSKVFPSSFIMYFAKKFY